MLSSGRAVLGPTGESLDDGPGIRALSSRLRKGAYVASGGVVVPDGAVHVSVVLPEGTGGQSMSAFRVLIALRLALPVNGSEPSEREKESRIGCR